ncbi:MAG: thiamine pyrophosphate-binding protein [Rhodospirillales bacterium]|nr:thiamine pyrophosphate-binding protein [Rhodospirillales bacterium]MBI2586513.1 thiamine pyrophosphate-binding protein [Rhodospirillales bacterium]
MTKPTLDRRQVLETLFPQPADHLFVSGLAGASKDAAGLTDDGDNLFTMAGTMGAAVPMGLGMALAAPEAKVAVITGDGEMLMMMGALATVASMAPANLSIVCLDNGCHGETGGQPGHTAMRTDLAKIGAGAGLPSTLTITGVDELNKGARFLQEAKGPRLLVVRITDGPATAYLRNMDPAACRLRFRNAYLGIR